MIVNIQKIVKMAKKVSMLMHAIHYVVITAAIVLVFHFMGVTALYTPITNAIVLFVVVVVSDMLFHSVSGYK